MNFPGGPPPGHNYPGGPQQGPNNQNGPPLSGMASQSDQPPHLQQQNTIYVFTTLLANEAASACVKGHFRNIIDFHRQLNPNDFLKNIQHQQMMHQQGQQGPPGPPGSRPGPNGLPPLMQQNEQLTSEQLKKRTEKLGKLKDISSMICPQDGSAAAAPTGKRGRNSAAAAAAAAAVAAANQNKPPHMMGQPGGPPGQGPPFMNGPNGPEQMMMYNNGNNPNEPFNPMMPNGPGGQYGPPGSGGPPGNPYDRLNMGPGSSSSSPSLQQQQQQQGPPPPYGQMPGSATKSQKQQFQKAGMPEKFDKNGKPSSTFDPPNTNSPGQMLNQDSQEGGSMNMFKGSGNFFFFYFNVSKRLVLTDMLVYIDHISPKMVMVSHRNVVLNVQQKLFFPHSLNLLFKLTNSIFLVKLMS